MSGILELHGVQREVTWEVKAKREADVMSALATITIRYDDFAIDKPDIAGFVSVEDEVTLQMQVIATAGDP
jgi:polyisoprenoid-binding protein YceI